MTTRVLQVIDSVDSGGAEHQLVVLAQNVPRDRIDLSVCSLHALDETSPVVIALRREGIPIVSMPGARWHDARHALHVAAHIRRAGVDVVHAHLPYGIATASLAGAITRRPVVATMHSVDDGSTQHNRLERAGVRVALRRGARVVVACAPEVGASGLRLGIAPAKLRIFENAIDGRRFEDLDPDRVASCRRALLGDRPGPLVVTVGRCVPQKDHELLVAAVPFLLERVPGARVAIVGPGGSSETAVRARVHADGLDDVVVLAGARDDIPEVLRAADCFVLTSRVEGLPLALLEAMAAGAPVVAAAVGGIPNVVDDGENGRLVTTRDPRAFATAIADVVTRPAEAQRLAHAARARVAAGNDAASWAAKLVALYEELAGPRS